jgi:hypothetical protein
MKPKRIPWALPAGLLLLFFASCGQLRAQQSWQPPRPVAVKGGSMWFNLTPSWITWVTAAQQEAAGGLLLRDGDVACTEDSWFVYKDGDGASLDMSMREGCLFISGKPVAVSPAREGGWDWLELASTEDLRRLRFLMLPDSLDEKGVSILNRLAAANPDLGLGILAISGYTSVASFFRPRILIAGGGVPAAEMAGLLEGQGQIEVLSVSARDADDLGFLAKLPNLRRLVLEDWNPARTGPLPKGMRTLRSLVLAKPQITDVTAVSALSGELEELSIVMSENVSSLQGLDQFYNLQTLILNMSPEVKDLSALTGLKKLARIGLPPQITQEQFSTFVAGHPGLRIVELIQCDLITDFSPLNSLSGLTGLIVSGNMGNLETITGLESLSFLGLQAELFNTNPEKIQRIRALLPNTLVVPAAPLCLGSGWILLLLPASALMAGVRSLAKRRRRGSA